MSEPKNIGPVAVVDTAVSAADIVVAVVSIACDGDVSEWTKLS